MASDKDKLWMIKVDIKKGKSIVGSDGSTCSPYLKVCWGKKPQKTKVVTKQSEPEWNFSCQFEIKKEKFSTRPGIEFELFEHKQFSEKEISRTTFPLPDSLILGEPCNYTVPMVINTHKSEVKCEIHIAITAVNFGKDKQDEERKKQEEVQRKFVQLVEQLATDAKAREGMLKLPYDARLRLVEQHRDKLANEKQPDDYVVLLIKEITRKNVALSSGNLTKSISSSNGSLSPTTPRNEDGLSISELRNISVALRSRGLDWIHQFHKLGATTRLVELLGLYTQQKDHTEDSLGKQLECLNCIKNLMNNTVGIGYIFGIKDSFKTIILCLGSQNEKINELAIGLLNTICFLPKINGHKLLIELLNYYKEQKKESRRFISIVESLKSKPGVVETRETLKTKSIYLSFINIIVNTPPEIDLRLALRQEFYWLGIKDILVNLSNYSYDDSPEMDMQITVFEDEESRDNKEMSERFNDFKGVNLDSVDEVIKTLLDRIRPMGLVDCIREIVKDLLLLPIDDDVGIRNWVLASRIIKQISLREKDIGIDEDILSLENLLLTCEQEAKEIPLKSHIESLKKDTQDLNKKITTQEIELKEKMEIMKKNDELNGKQFEEFTNQSKKKDEEINSLKEMIEKLKNQAPVVVVASSSAPAAAAPPPPSPTTRRSPTTTSTSPTTRGFRSPTTTSTSPTTREEQGVPPPPPPPPGCGPPPPPPPPGGGPPPPPPPPGGGPPPPPPPGGFGKGPPPPPGGFGKKAPAHPRKEVPLPGLKMKGLQWVSMNDKKIQGTIFTKFTSDSAKDINLDFKDIENVFAAKVIEKKESTAPKKTGPVQIIDPKTSQNLSIFLSQFKGKSYDEICGAIQKGDETMFQPNHIDALITFLPSEDDINNINEFLREEKEVSKLGPAEQFSLKIHSVPQVKSRLLALKFKNTYESKKTDLKLDIENFKQGTKEIKESEKIPKLLEVILILGNFINGGTARGNAFGFKLNTITKLADTKSTDNKISLVNYLTKVVVKDFPHLHTFAKDLTHVEAASKVSLSVLAAEVATLRKEFVQVQKSIETLNSGEEKDEFKTKFEDFCVQTSEDIDLITSASQQIETDYKELLAVFGEDSKSEPNEFFGMFLKFMDQYDKSTKENEQLSIQAEKIAKREAAKKLKEEEDAKKKQMVEEGKQKGEENIVDDLLNTIASGDAFKNRRRVRKQGKNVDLDSVEAAINDQN
ncbi:hypothetical protein DICPUDRAFT_150581 [Dictyostelium purpureum]|uniref:Actin binding protein n=1 Tax=Dictyostelium purpureum TaxID=5786 RepID=F0ZGP7_DICPU|nr:uncharacterized protein DICPUDRAFT_150581 [Dictyostelium purpureum]EGC36883.1 hypothetical protein DICPUDRAFT_150581 [Dictyostelium purpureum]|eukprot:XP_003286605.1 hypothetical protein DICPUDRAFT_150581 [Dictyostelium purpureum]